MGCNYLSLLSIPASGTQILNSIGHIVCVSDLSWTHCRPTLLTLQWRHNERIGISNYQPHDCLLNCLFKAQIKENIKAPRQWPLWEKFASDRWILCTKGQWSGKWCHHDNGQQLWCAMYVSLEMSGPGTLHWYACYLGMVINSSHT